LEVIAKKSHDYSPATCTAPRTCSTCGKTEGSALGHTDNEVACSRCGKITFETLTYSGYGADFVKNITLPKGSFNLIVTHNGEGYFCAKYFPTSDSWPYELIQGTEPFKSVTVINGGVTNAHINIESADGYWTITIEAAGN
jgi:hypothetical protein